MAGSPPTNLQRALIPLHVRNWKPSTITYPATDLRNHTTSAPKANLTEVSARAPTFDVPLPSSRNTATVPCHSARITDSAVKPLSSKPMTSTPKPGWPALDLGYCYPKFGRPLPRLTNSCQFEAHLLENPQRRCIPLLLIISGDTSIHQFDAEDEVESSSSYFHNKHSFEYGIRFFGFDASKALIRAPRQVRMRNPITNVQTMVPCEELCRISKSYAKQDEQLQMMDIEVKLVYGGTQRLNAEVSEGSVSWDLGTSEVSHVFGGITDRNLTKTVVASKIRFRSQKDAMWA